jgi:hypothetical protein
MITSTEVNLAWCHGLLATLATLSIIAASQHPANNSSNSADSSKLCLDIRALRGLSSLQHLRLQGALVQSTGSMRHLTSLRSLALIDIRSEGPSGQ